MSKVIKVLVTGAGGFLGRYIARDLLNENKNGSIHYEVYSLSRNHYVFLEEMGVQQFIGNLKNYTDVLNIVKQMDAVIHTASMVGMWGKKEDFYQTNVVGTENIIKACLETGVNRCVYTSTPSVAFGNVDLKNVNESIGYPEKHYCDYASTKKRAEEIVLKANCASLATVSLRPHLIFGPGDQNLIPRVLRARKDNRLKIVGDGENLVDVSYVENVSLLHVEALKKLSPTAPFAGKAYFVGQGPVKLWDFTNDILKRSNLSPVRKKIPFKLAYLIGWLFECFLKTTRNYKADPPMTRFVAMQLAKSHYYDHSAMENDFNFKFPISIEEGLNRYFKYSNLPQQMPELLDSQSACSDQPPLAP
jgi:nucleoside-diphosphate-sugar epimerase